MPFKEGRFGAVWALGGSSSNSQIRHVAVTGFFLLLNPSHYFKCSLQMVKNSGNDVKQFRLSEIVKFFKHCQMFAMVSKTSNGVKWCKLSQT